MCPEMGLRMLGVRLPEEMINELKKLARKRERSVAAEIRHLVRRELEKARQEQEKPARSR